MLFLLKQVRYVVLLGVEILLSSIDLSKAIVRSYICATSLTCRTISIDRTDMSDTLALKLARHITLTPGTYTLSLKSDIILVNALDYITEQDILVVKQKIILLA